MSPDVLLECPRTSLRDVLRVNVTERVWHSPGWGGEGVDSPYVSKIHCDNLLLSYCLWYRVYELNQIPIEVYLLCLYLYLHWAGSRLVGGVWPLGHYELPPNVSIPCNSPPSSSIIIIFKIQNTTKRTSIYNISLFNNGQMGLN